MLMVCVPSRKHDQRKEFSLMDRRRVIVAAESVPALTVRHMYHTGDDGSAFSFTL